MRYELLVGLRYTRAKRRNHFISFISLISMAGIALGVAALIVVLSVMNGFQKELRTRILGVASHVQIAGAPEGWDRIVTRGALDGGKFIAFAMKGAKVVGATVVNMGREMRFVKSLVQTAKDVNDADLANEGQQLRALAG